MRKLTESVVAIVAYYVLIGVHEFTHLTYSRLTAGPLPRGWTVHGGPLPWDFHVVIVTGTNVAISAALAVGITSALALAACVAGYRRGAPIVAVVMGSHYVVTAVRLLVWPWTDAMHIREAFGHTPVAIMVMVGVVVAWIEWYNADRIMPPAPESSDG